MTQKIKQTCPACERVASKFVNGVCERCRANFEIQHKGKMDVKWKPEDFKIHKPHSASHEPPPVIMEEEDARKHDMRVALEEARDFFKPGMRLLVQRKGNKTLALHAFCIALGWWDLIECESAVEVAVKIFANPKKKAAVTKAVKLFQDVMGKDVMGIPGERSWQGREGMAKARKKQLKKGK